MSQPILSQAYLRSLFDYDAETGVFTRLKSKRADRVGTPAGHVNKRGYHVISVDNKLYYAHRLAWLYMTGSWPADLVDHKDTGKSNNRFTNLRVVDETGNKQNRITPYATTTSGMLGVYKVKNKNKWYSKIKVDGRQVHLGMHDTPTAAHQTYVAAKRLYHPTCTL